MARRAPVVAMLLVGCAGAGASPEPAVDATVARLPGDGTFLLVHARTIDGAPLELASLDGTIVEPDALPAGAPRVDAAGAIVVPAFVDAHVHLDYLPIAEAHAAGGIAVAIDLGSPLAALGRAGDPLLVLRAGPMITAPGGYPLNSWGHAGYGIECSDPASCAARVDELAERGAALIKVPVDEGPAALDDAGLAAIVAAAHARELLVVAHALSDRDVRRAAAAGVDVLAHTPIARLEDDTIDALRGRAVISTLAAFGGSATATANLARLRDRGVLVVYGTDLGNTRTPGIDRRELALLADAGLDAAAIVVAATATPARLFGLSRHGSLAVGHATSFLLYRTDAPLRDPSALARPDVVVVDGRER